MIGGCKMGAVYKKELKSFFTTMTGYVFIAFILVIVAIFMTSLNLKGGYPDFEHNVGSVSFTFLFLIPILTMRSFSEERHSRTDQLLYSLHAVLSIQADHFFVTADTGGSCLLPEFVHFTFFYRMKVGPLPVRLNHEH